MILKLYTYIYIYVYIFWFSTRLGESPSCHHYNRSNIMSDRANSPCKGSSSLVTIRTAATLVRQPVCF